MTKRQLVTETLVGLFAFAVLGILFLLTVVLSREALFRTSTSIDVVFDDVMGLRVGDNVVSHGVNVGQVKNIAFTNGAVRVTALLSTPLDFRADYTAQVLSSSLLGGRYLHLHEGTPTAPAFAEPTLRGVPSPELIDTATQTIDEIRTALNDGILDDLKATFASVRAITERLANGEGTLGKLLTDDALHSDVASIASSFRTLSTRLENGEGTLGKLLSTDDQLYADAASAVSNINLISDRLANGEGTLGKLLAPDDTLYADLSTAVASLRTVGENLAAGEGTIGKLLADDEIYTEAQSLLREGRAAVDDLRETSPITTFSSIFFGIF